MKCVILAGGLGTRLSEETDKKPKPMVEIGGVPIIQHIMGIYSRHGIDDFVVCCGYKGYMIKEYFSNFLRHTSNFCIDLGNNEITMLSEAKIKWKVTLIDTGEHTQTGGRLRRVRDYIDDTFCMTYGDGLSDINVTDLVSYHKKHKKLATVTAVQPPGRFGSLSVDDYLVTQFSEKPIGSAGWINGGFFVLEPETLDYIDDDATLWEVQPLERLSANKQLAAYFHHGFWRPMDTLRDKMFLEDLYATGSAPWLKT